MRHTPILLLLLLCVNYTVRAADSESKIVTTDQGPVRGYKSNKGNFFEFHGIPYAKTPTGRDKFKAPLPAPVWSQPFEAVRENILCPQDTFIKDPQTDENDCLLVNVFVPDTAETDLPVVVYVHGGGYKGGSGNFLTPYEILQQGNFIAVNFNYRLNVQGFLCLGTEDIPGNAGMKDQVAALRWVKRNIAQFGGNPNDISISGQSAGSSAVELLMLSDTTTGLFNRISPESGSALSSWSIQMDPLENAKRLARKLNLTNVNDVYALEEFFKTAPFEDLTKDMFPEERDSTTVFSPCLERATGRDTFLTEAPVDIMKKGNFPKMPMLMGFADVEGLVRAPVFDKWKNEMNKNFVDFLPADLQFDSREQKEEIANKVKKFYFGDKPVSDESTRAYVDFFSDVIINYATLRSVKYQIEAGNNDVYLYQYSFPYKYEIAGFKTSLPNVEGAVHVAQTFMQLEASAGFFSNDIGDNADYAKMNALVKKLWIDFYRTGKPVPEITSDFPEGWPAVSTANGSPYVDLNIPVQLHKTFLLEERIRLWDEIYKNHYRTPMPPPELPPRRTEL